MIGTSLLSRRGPRYYFLQLRVALKELSALGRHFVNYCSLVILIGLLGDELTFKQKSEVFVQLVVTEVGSVHYVGLALSVAGYRKNIVDNL
jgi:hypothetical protein